MENNYFNLTSGINCIVDNSLSLSLSLKEYDFPPLKEFLQNNKLFTSFMKQLINLKYNFS